MSSFLRKNNFVPIPLSKFVSKFHPQMVIMNTVIYCLVLWLEQRIVFKQLKGNPCNKHMAILEKINNAVLATAGDQIGQKNQKMQIPQAEAYRNLRSCQNFNFNHGQNFNFNLNFDHGQKDGLTTQLLFLICFNLLFTTCIVKS